MKKSLSVLLAIAMVFSMFAGLAYANDQQDVGEKLKELGLIKGDGNDLMIDQEWKRQDVTVILSRLLGVEEEAQNTQKGHTFADVKDPYYDGYITWAIEEGLFEGHSDSNFGYGESISTKQFLAVMLRALGYVEETTGDNYDNVPQLAVELGLASEDTDFDAVATRGDYFQVIFTTLNTNVKGSNQTLGNKLGLPGYEAPAIAASAVGAKKIAVTFSKAVNADDVEFLVKKGSVTINVKEITFSDNNKTATLELASKLTEGEYVITVTGVSQEALTTTVIAENEKVTKIEFTSDKAPYDPAVADNKGIKAFYKVYNQYNEDITNGTTVTVSPGKGDLKSASNGEIKVEASSPFVLGEKVHMSILHNSTGTFESKLLEVSPAAKVAKVEIVKFHQPDDKALTEGETSPSDYYIVVEAVDQYGNTVPARQIGEDVVTDVSNKSLFDVARDGNGNGDYTTEGDDTVLKLANGSNGEIRAGKGSIYIVSKTTGARAEIEITVKEAEKVDVFNVSAPELAVDGEETIIPFSAINQFGEEITDAAVLNNMTTKNSSEGNLFFRQNHVKGVAELVLDTTNTNAVGNDDPISVYFTFVTNTGKVSQLTITLQPAAEAVSIAGVKDFTTAYAVGANAELDYSNIIAKDQYGRDYDLDGKLTGNGGDYQVKVETSAADKVSLNGGSNFTIDENADKVTFDALAKGNSTITLTLLDDQGEEIDNSAYTFTARVVEKADIKSYAIEPVGTLYDQSGRPPGGPLNPDYAKDLVVNGFLANGTKVAIPVSYYSVTSDVYNPTTGKLDGSLTPVGSDDDTRTVSLIVIIDADTDVLVEKITVAKATPEAQTLSLNDSTAPYTKESDDIVSVSHTDINNTDDVVTLVNAMVKAVDQYGVTLTNDFKNTDIFVTNTTDGKPLGNLGAGDSFNVTVVTSNAKTFKFKVILK